MRRCAVASSSRSKRRRASAAPALSYKDLNGYPVQTIDNPAVNALRNSYQSAFSHYLAGFVYEALGEPSLAAAGYRQAIELHPNVPALEEALAGLDQRVAAPDDGKTDVLFEIETGLVPARVSRQFNLPIPINGRWVLVSASFPVLRSQDPGVVPSELRIEGSAPLVPVPVTSVDAMARKALQDEMPGIMLRTFIRSLVKATAQYQAQRAASKRRNKGDDVAGRLARPDGGRLGDRLGGHREGRRAQLAQPACHHLDRSRQIAAGTITASSSTPPPGLKSVEVDIEGRYAFVSLRLIERHVVRDAARGPAARREPCFVGSAAAAEQAPASTLVAVAEDGTIERLDHRSSQRSRRHETQRSSHARSRRLRSGGGGLRQEEGIREARLRLRLSDRRRQGELDGRPRPGQDLDGGQAHHHHRHRDALHAAGDLLKVDATLNNDSSKVKRVAYKFRWIDREGMRADDEETWKPLLMYENSNQLVTGIAPSNKAVDFRLILLSQE